MKAIIFTKGGLINSVFSDNPELKVELIDYDNLECMNDDLEREEFKQYAKKMETEAKAMKEVF